MPTSARPSAGPPPRAGAGRFGRPDQGDPAPGEPRQADRDHRGPDPPDVSRQPVTVKAVLTEAKLRRPRPEMVCEPAVACGIVTVVVKPPAGFVFTLPRMIESSQYRVTDSPA